MNIRSFAVLLYFLLGSHIAWAQTYTFTTAGQTGTTGPDQTMIDTAYSGTNLAGQVTSIGGIQNWVVPANGPYLIEAFGAQGYGSYGGRGAHISGEFNLTSGDTLKILVGQKAPPYLNYPSTTYNYQFGGGGGSFVTQSDNTPLVVAGGGGGSHAGSYLAGADGQITNAGAAGALGVLIGAGGTNGLGGQQATSADGGAGLLGNGNGTAGGQAFVNGGVGGSDEGLGGFGGGGGTSSWNNYRGGGGGGYSGGGGGNNNSSTSCCAAGGGGGSYNAGTNPVNLAGLQLGDGLVRITLLDPPAIRVTGTTDFGAVVVYDGTATHTFTIHNDSGSAELLMGPIGFVDGDNGDWSVTGPPGLGTIPPGGSTSFDVTFDPSAPGSRSTTMRIGSNDPDDSPLDIPLTGEGLILLDVDPRKNIPTLSEWALILMALLLLGWGLHHARNTGGRLE